MSAAPLRPFHTFVRTTEERFRPPQIATFRPSITSAQAVALKAAPEAAGQQATILREAGASGGVPTIVLGGLVPDATEQVFLLRRFLLRSGDIYYVNYPNGGFSLDLLTAQLTDLVTELGSTGQPPVIFAVSFGAGIIMDWLRRTAQQAPLLAGVVLVSPVTCVADLIAPGVLKPQTLLGRALKPLLDTSLGNAEGAVEKSRTIFLRMFEAGAQNKLALRTLMTERESERLRGAVMGTIRNLSVEGACQRVRALATMQSPTEYFSPRSLPLTEAPVLTLFAEREDAVLDAGAPSVFALEGATRAYFPRGVARRVCAKPGQAAVQHASLIFHVFEFLPPLRAFYKGLRRRQLAVAA